MNNATLITTVRDCARRLAAWAGVLLLLASGGLYAGDSGSRPAVGVQLYSVRDLLDDDFDGTLEELAALGFQGVEFAKNEYGSYADNPLGLRQLLDRLRLRASGAHVGFDELGPDRIHRTLLFLKTLGVSYVIVAWDERAWDPAKVADLVADLNRLGKVLAPFGMTMGFHNHAHEFAAFQGATFWDFIARNTSPDILLQLDAGWVLYAGKNPIEYVRRYPGRTLTTHLKVATHDGEARSPIIGDDGYSWAELIRADRQVGGTRWLVLEQEEYPEGMSSLQAVAASKVGLDRILGTLD